MGIGDLRSRALSGLALWRELPCPNFSDTLAARAMVPRWSRTPPHSRRGTGSKKWTSVS